jgi:hypothetical protein
MVADSLAKPPEAVREEAIMRFEKGHGIAYLDDDFTQKINDAAVWLR